MRELGLARRPDPAHEPAPDLLLPADRLDGRDQLVPVVQDLGRQVAGGLLRKVPLFGNAVANNVVGEDPRYSMKLNQAQLDKAWKQVQVQFRECPKCNRIVCLSDFDTQSGFCQEDSPRSQEIAEARATQAGAAVKGFMGAFGLGEVFDKAKQAAEQAQLGPARCPKDGTLAPAGTKFCPECGSPMVQPQPPAPAVVCPQCGTETKGAKFCPNCGTKIEQPPAAPANCPKCGAETKGAKFCANCGTKLI